MKSSNNKSIAALLLFTGAIILISSSFQAVQNTDSISQNETVYGTAINWLVVSAMIILIAGFIVLFISRKAEKKLNP